MFSKIKFSAVAAVIVLITAAMALTVSRFADKRLVIYDAESGKVYASFDVQTGDRFSVEFVHSVNNSPVKDIYEIRDNGEIYVVSTVYHGFGAGVQTELEGDERLVYRDGAMIVENINKKIPYLAYFVGTVSDHTLQIGDKSISLRELCGKNANIVFEYKRQIFR